MMFDSVLLSHEISIEAITNPRRQTTVAWIVVIEYLCSWLWAADDIGISWTPLLGYSSHVLRVSRVAARGNAVRPSIIARLSSAYFLLSLRTWRLCA